MSNEYRELLSEVFCDVIEKLAFMFGEPVEIGDFEPCEAGYLKASLTFSGHMSGELDIYSSMDMALDLAANVLGADPDDDDVQEQVTDSLKELLNVTCGNLLVAIAGEEPVFEVSAPDAGSLSENEWKELIKSEELIGILVDECPVILRLKVDK